MTRSDELTAIDDYIALYGVTMCPPRYVEPTSVWIPAGVAAARLASTELKPPIEYARLLHLLLVAWRGRR